MAAYCKSRVFSEGRGRLCLRTTLIRQVPHSTYEEDIVDMEDMERIRAQSLRRGQSLFMPYGVLFEQFNDGITPLPLCWQLHASGFHDSPAETFSPGNIVG